MEIAYRRVPVENGEEFIAVLAYREGRGQAWINDAHSIRDKFGGNTVGAGVGFRAAEGIYTGKPFPTRTGTSRFVLTQFSKSQSTIPLLASKTNLELHKGYFAADTEVLRIGKMNVSDREVYLSCSDGIVGPFCIKSCSITGDKILVPRLGIRAYVWQLSNVQCDVIVGDEGRSYLSCAPRLNQGKAVPFYTEQEVINHFTTTLAENVDTELDSALVKQLVSNLAKRNQLASFADEVVSHFDYLRHIVSTAIAHKWSDAKRELERQAEAILSKLEEGKKEVDNLNSLADSLLEDQIEQQDELKAFKARATKAKQELEKELNLLSFEIENTRKQLDELTVKKETLEVAIAKSDASIKSQPLPPDLLHITRLTYHKLISEGRSIIESKNIRNQLMHYCRDWSRQYETTPLDWLKTIIENPVRGFIVDSPNLPLHLGRSIANAHVVHKQIPPHYITYKQFEEGLLKRVVDLCHARQQEWVFLVLSNFDIAPVEAYLKPLLAAVHKEDNTPYKNCELPDNLIVCCVPASKDAALPYPKELLREFGQLKGAPPFKTNATTPDDLRPISIEVLSYDYL